jgi:hypothetical protein
MHSLFMRPRQPYVVVRLVVVVKVCHDWCSSILSPYNVYHSGLQLNYFYVGVFDSLEKYVRW